MLQRTKRLFVAVVLYIGALPPGFAIGSTIFINAPAGPVSQGSNPTIDISVQNNSTVSTLSVTPAATWSGSSLYGLFNTTGSTINAGGFTVNTGSVVYGGTAGIQNQTGATISGSGGSNAITNFGTIGQFGGLMSTYGVYNAGSISSFNIAIFNPGIISGSHSGIYNDAGATITSTALWGIRNTAGVIGGAGSQYGIYNLGTIQAQPGAQNAIQNISNIQGTVDGIYNGATGVISAFALPGGAVGIANVAGTISSITNLGSITGVYGIQNGGTITRLNNLQGGGTPLTYTGVLPTNYNVIVNSTSAYGKLSSPGGLAGATTFGVSSTSTLAANTYTAVLSGFTSVNLTNQVLGIVTGTLGAASWTLSPEGGAPTTWDLIVTCPSSGCGGGGGGGGGGSGGDSSGSSSGSSNSSTQTPATQSTTNIATGGTFGLSTIGVTTNPVFAGGTLALTSGASTSQSFTVTSAGGTITTPSGGSASMTGALTGPGAMTVNGGGTLVLSGANTYSGGTTVSGGTLDVAGSSPTGTGDVFVSSPSTLMGTGTIAGNVVVAGTFKPGNSPGYLSVLSNVTVNSGGTYQQDIAGKGQASATSPAGATGYYSFLNVGGQYTINPGATLSPGLQNLFSPSESGYGSAPYVPVVGDKFRIITATNGVTGKFTTLTQPAGLASGTQFLQFYNYNGSNSLDLAVAPSSYATASSGNKNAQSVGSALDKLVVANQTGVSTSTQDSLLYPVSGQSIANLGSYLQGMSGEIYGATLAVVPQTTQRIQAAVLSRLGDSMFVATRGMAQVTPAANSAISATNPGGQPTAAMSSNPNVNPYAASSGSGSMRNGAAWGEIAYQYGNRSSDSNSGGWSSNLVQAVVGLDAYSQGGTKAGGGLALSNTNVTAAQGSGTVQQGTLFLYGKMPAGEFVVDGMASYGFNSTNNTRNDPTGITGGMQAKNVQGNDALVSAGVSMPIETESATLAPYARVTWQNVSQNGFNEGSATSALTVNSYNGNGVRGVIGLTAGSKATDPIKEKVTYKANIGVGVDSNAVMSPTLNASIAGQGTQIYTPNPSTAFVQIGVYGTAKFADNAYAYAGITSELRGGQALVGGNVGVMIQF